MNLKMAIGVLWKFFLAIAFAVQLVFPSAAAEFLSTLTCNVTQQPDGFSYNLSRPPSSPECTSCWELKNKTVVALGVDFLTQNFCQPYLHYIRDCPEVWEHAHCEINCSHFLDLPTTTVNSTLICITKSWCLTTPIFGLGVAGIIFLVVVVLVALQRCNIGKCRRRESDTMGASYTAANGKNTMEQEEMVEININT